MKRAAFGRTTEGNRLHIGIVVVHRRESARSSNRDSVVDDSNGGVRCDGGRCDGGRGGRHCHHVDHDNDDDDYICIASEQHSNSKKPTS